MVALRSAYERMRNEATKKTTPAPYETEERREMNVASQFEALLRAAE